MTRSKQAAVEAPTIRVSLELPGDRLITVAELSHFLGVAQQTLFNWKYERRGPKVTMVGSRIRYRRADVDQYLAEHTAEVLGATA